MLPFERERERELRELTFTSDFIGGYHLPLMHVNPKFCLFALHLGFYFLTRDPPAAPEDVAYATFLQLPDASHTFQTLKCSSFDWAADKIKKGC